jgi:hypothetical protein
MLASRETCPTVALIDFFGFHPKGLSEIPLYRERQVLRGLAIPGVSSIADLAMALLGRFIIREERLEGGTGAVLKDPAMDKAIDTLVFIVRVGAIIY